MKKPTILIAEDHPLFRVALCQTLASQLDDPLLLEAEDFPALQQSLEKNQNIDLVLLDLHIPGAEGFSALIYITAYYSHLPVMIVSAHEEPEIIRRAIDHGATGFLPKGAPVADMTEALTRVLRGELWIPANIGNKGATNSAELDIADAMASLTPQQFKVAVMVNQGLLNKQIAYELKITEATVKAHMTEIFRKLGVHSRTQVAVALSQLGVSPANSTDQLLS